MLNIFALGSFSVRGLLVAYLRRVNKQLKVNKQPTSPKNKFSLITSVVCNGLTVKAVSTAREEALFSFLSPLWWKTLYVCLHYSCQ